MPTISRSDAISKSLEEFGRYGGDETILDGFIKIISPYRTAAEYWSDIDEHFDWASQEYLDNYTLDHSAFYNWKEFVIAAHDFYIHGDDPEIINLVKQINEMNPKFVYLAVDIVTEEQLYFGQDLQSLIDRHRELDKNAIQAGINTKVVINGEQKDFTAYLNDTLFKFEIEQIKDFAERMLTRVVAMELIARGITGDLGLSS